MPKFIRSNLIIFAAGFLLISIFSTIRYERFASKRQYGDFHVYYVTGERMLAGQSIYVDETEKVTPYKYSPLTASFFSLLALSNERTAAGVWHCLNLVFLLVSVIAGGGLARKISDGHGKYFVAWSSILAVIGISPAILHCMNSGQVGIAILFCYVLGVYFTSRDRDIAAGFFFALSCMFKYLPILILPYFIWQKKWKLVWSMIGWLFVLHFLPALWLGWDINLRYLRQFLPFLTGTTLDHISLLDFKNQSMWAYLYRLFFYDLGLFEIRNHPHWILAFGAILFTALYGLVISRTRRGFLVLGCSLLAILIVIFNPNAWKHNFVLFLLPYQILLAAALQLGWQSRQATLLMLVSILFFASNQSLVGWGGRLELMSLSILLLAGLVLFAGLLLSRFPQDPAPKHNL